MDTNWRPSLDARGGPVYRALADAICAASGSGELAPGTRLPPVRELAFRLQISPGAVARAYRLATDRGALEATVGRGTFVRAPGEARRTAFELLVDGEADAAERIDLRGNRAVDVGQDADLTAALSRMIARDGPLPLTDYRFGADDADAQEAVAEWMRAGGAPAEGARLLITPGAQTGAMLCLAAEAQGGQGVALCEPVVHPGLKDAAEAVGVRLEPVATDAEGLVPAALDAACALLRPDAVLLSATLQNPTLATMSLARREAVAAVARARNVALIEDDVYGWLGDERLPPLAALAPERAWLIAGFSKCVAAGLRAGFLLAPPGKVARARRLHQAVLHHTPYLVTGLAAELARSGDADRIRARVAAETRARAAMAEGALGRLGARTHPAVSFVFLPTPEGWSSGEFAAAAAEAGVLVAPRAAYAAGRGAAEPDFVRIALGARVSRERLAEGLARLARLVEDGPRGVIT